MANTTNFNWETPDDTDLVKDGAAAIRTLGSAIDTSLVDLKGGTTGQVLAKNSNTDMDFVWSSVDPLTILDAKGDLITATAADTPARLAVGTNGQYLSADSSTSTGLKWVTAAGGKLLQVVSTTKTDSFTSNTTTAWTDITGLSASITPTVNTSKIFVQLTCDIAGQDGTNGYALRLMRDSTAIGVGDTAGSRISAGTSGYAATGGSYPASVGIDYLDSPATTSALTYKAQFYIIAGNVYINRSQVDTNSSSYFRSVSTITLFEIGA